MTLALAVAPTGAQAQATCSTLDDIEAGIASLFGGITTCTGSYADQVVNGGIVAGLTDQIDSAEAEVTALQTCTTVLSQITDVASPARAGPELGLAIAQACPPSTLGGTAPCTPWAICLDDVPDQAITVMLDALSQATQKEIATITALQQQLATAVTTPQGTLEELSQLMQQLLGIQQAQSQAQQASSAPQVTVVTLLSDARPIDAAMAALGAYAAERELGVTTRAVPVTRAQARAALRAAARTSATVVAVGASLLRDAVAVARAAPATRVVVIGDDLGRRPAGPANVSTVGFDQRGAGRVAGYLAAKALPAGRPAAVATIGVGADDPAAGRLRRGFREGALTARSDVRVLGATLRAGAPASSCAAQAARHGRAGARTVFVLSGPRCAAAAARVPGVRTIVNGRRTAARGEAGTVIDRIDLAVFKAIQRTRVRTRQNGVLDWIEDVRTGGTGVATAGRRAPVLQAVQAVLTAQSARGTARSR